MTDEQQSTSSMKVYVPLTVKMVDPEGRSSEIAPVSLTFDLRSLLNSTAARSSTGDGNDGSGISRSMNVSLTILLPDDDRKTA